MHRVTSIATTKHSFQQMDLYAIILTAKGLNYVVYFRNGFFQTNQKQYDKNNDKHVPASKDTLSVSKLFNTTINYFD